MAHPSSSFSATVRLRLDDHPGSFARLAAAIAAEGGSLGAIDLVRVERKTKVRDVVILAADAAHLDEIVTAVEQVEGTEVLHLSDRTFLLHAGGKIEVTPKTPLRTRDDLSRRTHRRRTHLEAIADDPELVWTLTTKGNMVAVVTDGSAVLGLGDIGPAAALPVMEGKAMLFKEFGGVDAFPICLDTQDVDEIVAVVRALAPGFGGINLEDIAAPRCFEIEERLNRELEIPCSTTTSTGRRSSCWRRYERAARRRQAARRDQDRDDRVWSGRDGGDEDPRASRRPPCGRLRRGWRALPWPPRRQPGEAGLCREHESRERARLRRRGARRCRRLHRRLRPGRRDPCRDREHGPDGSCSRSPTRGRRSTSRRSRTASRSSPAAAPTIRTRSTTCSRSRACSAAPSTPGRRRSRRR